MTVSIIIAVKTWQRRLEECVNKCLEVDYPDFEILILPDAGIVSSLGGELLRNEKVRVIPTGAVGPAFKRDRAMDFSKGDIMAFIDDDAFPSRDWLKNACIHFNDSDVAAVGGPAITPPADNLRQQASGAVFASFLVSGPYTYRYLPKPTREVCDYPSCNFLVRTSVMKDLGGFNTTFWPGEDTKLCLDITQRLKKKIIYDPRVLIYHHRRELFMSHIRQVSSYALHRGYFVKRYPETSLKVSYFIPSIFLLVLLFGGIAGVLFEPVRVGYVALLMVYLATVFCFSFSRTVARVPFVYIGILCTHIAYGMYFIKGLFSTKLPEE